jgi:tight adherence protein B
MTGLLLGLTLGVGLFLVWWSFWTPDQDPRPRRGRPRLVVRLEDDLVHAGYPTLTPRTVGVAGAIAFSGVFLLGHVLVGVPAIATCFALMAGYAPLAFVRMRARHRRSRLRDLWPDAVDNIASAVRAGLALPEALAQLASRGPEDLRPAFAAFAEDYRLTGRFQDCLDRLKDRLSDPVGDRLVESMRIAREVGGSDLGRLLRTLSTFLREDARTRAEMETRQSWTVNSARLAVAAPWVVLAMLSTRPESVQAYSTRPGVLVLVAGAAVTLVAYRAMVRIGRLPEDERVLR